MNTLTPLHGSPQSPYGQSRTEQPRLWPPRVPDSCSFREAGRPDAKTHISRILPATLAKSFLVGWLLAGGVTGFAPALEAAQTRNWTGDGDGHNWSDPLNWIPRSPPGLGDDLVIEKSGEFTPTSMVNDLTGLTIHSMSFSGLSVFTTDWFLDGNDLTITGDVSAGFAYDQDIRFNCGVILGQSVTVRAGENSQDSLDPSFKFQFNGPLDLNGHDLTLFCGHNSRFEVRSQVTGQGNIRVVSGNPADSPTVVFGGAQANTFVGAITVERLSDTRPCQVSFDKAGGIVVNTRLHIGDGCQVSLQRADQIGDDAVTSITGGGRLLLNGHPETLGSLLLTNVTADADSTLVDASGTTLALRGGITTSVFNEQGALPTIKGTLGLPPGIHTFDLNNASFNSPGIRLQGQLVGGGGFSKFGNASLALQSSNTFSGGVSVNEGILEVQDSHALGATSSGVTITDGSITLRNVFINGETLFVRGTQPVTANTAGSFLNCVGVGGWLGRIELDQNLVVNSTDLCILGGPIVGPGGFEFTGSRVQIAGSGSSAARSDYSGLTRVLCDLLIVNLRPAFRGDVIVGGGFGPQYEVRWDSAGADQGVGGSASLTVHTNGLVNLNGNNDAFTTLTFHGGRVVTGSGTLIAGPVTTHPTNVTVTIDGNLQLFNLPTTRFNIADGPANPDLAVNAIISDGFNAAGIEKTGDGQLDLHRANTYRGPTLVQAGTLGLLNNNALGGTSQGTTVASGATVAFGIQANTVLEPFTIAGAGVGGTVGALVTGADVWINTNIVLNGGASIRAEGTNSRIQVNNISGTGPLTKLGSGLLVLRGDANNTYSGDTLVTEGILELAKPGTIASVPGHLIIGTSSIVAPPAARVEQGSSFTIVGSVTVNAGGLWDLNGSSEGFSIPDLQGHPPLTLNNSGRVQTGAGTFFLPVGGDVMVNPGLLGGSSISGRIGLDAGAHRFIVGRHSLALGSDIDCNVTAAISETGVAADLQKEGTGLLRLAGTNTHRGSTVVSSGTLRVDGVQPQSTVRVFDGGRFQGVGIAGSVELLGPSATVAPGASPGLLTCSNFNLGAVNRGILQIELNGPGLGAQYDQISARGAVNLTGLTLQAFLGFASSVDQQFTIINNDGGDPVVGAFEGLPQNASLPIGGERFTINYTGGTGNDVVLTRLITPHLAVTTLPATEVPNYAVDFDGEDDRVNVGTNTFPVVTNNFTIEVWVNPTAARLTTAEANTGISDITSQRHAVFPDQGNLSYGAGHAGAGLSIGTNGISVFEHADNYLPSLLVYSNAIPGWTHVALVYANRQPKLFVNGTLVRTGLVSTKTFVHPGANLGGSIQGLTYGNFQGQLDEVRVWNGALSQAQIQANLNRSLTGSEAGLLVYYRCDETNGASLADSASTSPNPVGTLTNGAAIVLSGALPPGTLNGPTVTLNGLAVPGGADATVWFEWGTTTNYGQVTAVQAVGNGFRNVSFFQKLTGLAAGEYQFRAAGSNGFSTSFGLNQSFTLLHGAPLLRIENAGAGLVRLLWPTNAAGFTLESNTNLNTTGWSSAPALPVSVVGTNNVALDATTSSERFYRLVHQ